MSIERMDIEPKGPGGRALPFAKAVRAGVFVFVSGQVAAGADGEIVQDSIVPQTRQTYIVASKAAGDLDDGAWR